MNSLLIYSSKGSDACREMLSIHGTNFLTVIADNWIDVCSAETLKLFLNNKIKNFPKIERIPALLVIDDDNKIDVLIDDKFQNYIDKKLKSVKFSPNVLVQTISPIKNESR